MSNLRTLALMLSGVVLIVAGCDLASVAPEEAPAEQALQHGDPIPGRYIVVLDRAAAGKHAAVAIDALAEDVGVEPSHRYAAALPGFAAELSQEALGRLRADARVAFVEPDRFLQVGPISINGKCDKNPSAPGCGGGGSDPQETPWGITRVGGAGDGTGKTACVLDTGADLDHPDLNVDEANSITVFTRGKDSKSADDGHGHGSHVSGTIAALDNTIGVIGVAPGATIVAIKVLSSSGSGSTSGVIEGVDYVAANPGLCDVANMSLGGGVSTALDQAVVNASQGTPFTLAAGNESDHANNHSPARANGNNIYTISAIDANDQFASFSNYGNPPVDYAAPGVAVKSTFKNGGYATYNGTSMAAPHVAGLLLLGQVRSDGTAQGDPDGNPDPIAHR